MSGEGERSLYFPTSSTQNERCEFTQLSLPRHLSVTIALQLCGVQRKNRWAQCSPALTQPQKQGE
jgi:hypothetical protein